MFFENGISEVGLIYDKVYLHQVFMEMTDPGTKNQFNQDDKNCIQKNGTVFYCKGGVTSTSIKARVTKDPNFEKKNPHHFFWAYLDPKNRKN